MKSGVWATLAVCGVLCSCGNKMDTREAVERGVLKGVAARGINPDSMDVSVSSVKFHGKDAEAVVSFAPKGGKISDGLTMRYMLEQRNNEWVITGRSGLNMKNHTNGMQPAPSAMDQNSGADTVTPAPSNAGSDPGQALPSGHPPLSGSPQ